MRHLDKCFWFHSKTESPSKTTRIKQVGLAFPEYVIQPIRRSKTQAEDKLDRLVPATYLSVSAETDSILDVYLEQVKADIYKRQNPDRLQPQAP
jgi:hypothetical protein